MRTVEPITHSRRDERGVAWIADTNTKVIEVVLDQAAYGWDAAEIHAALAFYHDHAGALDAPVQRQIENYRRLRTDAAG